MSEKIVFRRNSRNRCFQNDAIFPCFRGTRACPEVGRPRFEFCLFFFGKKEQNILRESGVWSHNTMIPPSGCSRWMAISGHTWKKKSNCQWIVLQLQHVPLSCIVPLNWGQSYKQPVFKTGYNRQSFILEGLMWLVARIRNTWRFLSNCSYCLFVIHGRKRLHPYCMEGVNSSEGRKKLLSTKFYWHCSCNTMSTGSAYDFNLPYSATRLDF